MRHIVPLITTTTVNKGWNARWQIRLKGRVARSSRFLLPPQYLEEPSTSLLMPCVLLGAWRCWCVVSCGVLRRASAACHRLVMVAGVR